MFGDIYNFNKLSLVVSKYRVLFLSPLLVTLPLFSIFSRSIAPEIQLKGLRSEKCFKLHSSRPHFFVLDCQRCPILLWLTDIDIGLI